MNKKLIQTLLKFSTKENGWSAYQASKGFLIEIKSNHAYLYATDRKIAIKYDLGAVNSEDMRKTLTHHDIKQMLLLQLKDYKQQLISMAFHKFNDIEFVYCERIFETYKLNKKAVNIYTEQLDTLKDYHYLEIKIEHNSGVLIASIDETQKEVTQIQVKYLKLIIEMLKVEKQSESIWRFEGNELSPIYIKSEHFEICLMGCR